MASFAPDAESVGGLPTSVHGQPSDGSDDRKAAPILHNLHLVTWRIFRGSTPSRTSLAAPEISTRQGGAAPPQKAATKEPGSLSRHIFIHLVFHLIELV
jgi:hypothetical protein